MKNFKIQVNTSRWHFAVDVQCQAYTRCSKASEYAIL